MTNNRNKLIERRSVSLFLFKIKRVTDYLFVSIIITNFAA